MRANTKMLSYTLGVAHAHDQGHPISCCVLLPSLCYAPACAQVAEKSRIKQHNKDLDDLYNQQLNQLDEACCAIDKVWSILQNVEHAEYCVGGWRIAEVVVGSGGMRKGAEGCGRICRDVEGCGGVWWGCQRLWCMHPVAAWCVRGAAVRDKKVGCGV